MVSSKKNLPSFLSKLKLGNQSEPRNRAKLKRTSLNVVCGLLSLLGALLILSAWVCIAYAFESL